MIVLDENLRRDQFKLLRKWRISAKQIGYEIGSKSIDDTQQIIPLLRRLARPTFFTADFDFWRRDLCHSKYCIACLDVGVMQTAFFCRRFLRHRTFNSHAKRMGRVIRVSPAGIRVWTSRAPREHFVAW